MPPEKKRCSLTRAASKQFLINTNLNRRGFLKNSALFAGAALSILPGTGGSAGFKDQQTVDSRADQQQGELLYNGITLPAVWPPRDMKPNAYDPMPVPYLESPPEVIPIDVGRQLFVDDFLIEKTDLKREFYQPVKFKGNPILSPKTAEEMGRGFCPMAAPFSDGCFYDAEDKLFKLWYQAGWSDDKTALAFSADGIHWERPKFDVVPGTNLVISTKGLVRDGVSVWIDHNAKPPDERFKLYMYVREGKAGELLKKTEGSEGSRGLIWTSRDGIHWTQRGKIGRTGDNSTFFYNPFRKKWVFTVRAGRAAPPWTVDPWKEKSKGRARSYWENDDFLAALGEWKGYDPVFWLGADKLDHRRPHYEIGQEPQLYKVDAVGYESLMIGLQQLHYGPSNQECAIGGFPKLTELQLAFSRDGFHWDRTNRKTFIGATLQKQSWERAYIHSIGGVCNVVGDKLYFYYTAFQGDESKGHVKGHWNGMYAKGSTGLAVLRRDGFASMDAGEEEGIIFTRPLVFTGKYLFVNLECPKGTFFAEVCQEDGKPIPGFAREDCLPMSVDSTKQIVAWKDGDNVESLIGKPIRFKFYLRNANLFSFWVSKNRQGASGGATAAGGPGLTGTWDV